VPEPLVFNIQRFSIHDGPGIRTTVFFSGCPLRCKWCHNPEGQRFPGESILTADKYIDTAGSTRSVDLLVRELEKDRIFFEESGGGVTISGGEPLAQDMEYITHLIRELKRKGISVAVDTCGEVLYEAFYNILPWVDLFLFDIKLLPEDMHISLTGHSNRRILTNLSRLNRDGAVIALRLPLLSGINDTVEDMKSIAEWLSSEKLMPLHISLLPYHAYARGKYDDMSLEYPEYSAPDQEQLTALADFWEQSGYSVGIGGGIEDLRILERDRKEWSSYDDH